MVGGVQGLRQKTQSLGIIVCATQDEVCGFGLELLDQEVRKGKHFPAAKGHEMPASGPETHFWDHGKNKEGCRTGGILCVQITDILVSFNVLYSYLQLVSKVESSAGHVTRREDELHTSLLNVRWGGAAW